MPAKPKLRGYIKTLIKEYLAHCVEQGLPPPNDNYVLIISFTNERPAPNYRPAGIELRLRTTEDMSDTEQWATIHTTLSPYSYVRHLINKERKKCAKKGITIDEYVVGTPTEPILDGWKEKWKPQWYTDQKKI